MSIHDLSPEQRLLLEQNIPGTEAFKKKMEQDTNAFLAWVASSPVMLRMLNPQAFETTELAADAAPQDPKRMTADELAQMAAENRAYNSDDTANAARTAQVSSFNFVVAGYQADVASIYQKAGLKKQQPIASAYAASAGVRGTNGKTVAENYQVTNPLVAAVLTAGQPQPIAFNAAAVQRDNPGLIDQSPLIDEICNHSDVRMMHREAQMFMLQAAFQELFLAAAQQQLESYSRIDAPAVVSKQMNAVNHLRIASPEPFRAQIVTVENDLVFGDFLQDLRQRHAGNDMLAGLARGFAAGPELENTQGAPRPAPMNAMRRHR